MQKPIEIVVDGGGTYDPSAGQTDVNIPYLKGQGFYIEKIGYGTYDYDKYSLLSTGGFRLSDTTFSTGERYYIHVVDIAYGYDASTYTNGFNFAQVISALYNRISWRSSAVDGIPALDSTNSNSRSGRYFQDFHALVTLNNVFNTMEKPSATQQEFNDYLETLQRSVIMRCLAGVFNVPEFITQGLLFDRYGYNDQQIDNTDLFVGYRLFAPATPGIGIKIDSVSLYFTEDVTFNLYLFHDSKKAAVWFGEVSAVANTQTVINLTDVVLNYIAGTNMGGSWYLGYFQSDIGSAKAYNENKSVCYRDYPFGWDPIESKKNAGEYDFDRQIISTGKTYGLNVQLTAFRDHTWKIVKEPYLFDNAIGLQHAVQVVEQVLYSARMNSDQRKVQSAVDSFGIQLDLNGVAAMSDSPQTFGLKKQLDAELKRLKEAFYPSFKPTVVNLC